jgi:S-adenosylmethionine:tRNA ribosyltransferase-isomerase
MHEEWYEVPAETAGAIAAAPGRIVALGTTTVRALESAALGPRQLRPGADRTRLYIRPGFEFRIVDALLTNFHMPRSSLLILVSAFASLERVRSAYQEALTAGYRFLSFGDAMLIV